MENIVPGRAGDGSEGFVIAEYFEKGAAHAGVTTSLAGGGGGGMQKGGGFGLGLLRLTKTDVGRGFAQAGFVAGLALCFVSCSCNFGI